MRKAKVQELRRKDAFSLIRIAKAAVDSAIRVGVTFTVLTHALYRQKLEEKTNRYLKFT